MKPKPILLLLTALAGCATGPNPQDHQIAMETVVAIRANVPRAIALAKERGPEAEARARKEARRWLLGTGYCSADDKAELERTLAECLEFSGGYADAKRQFRADRWNYLAGNVGKEGKAH